MKLQSEQICDLQSQSLSLEVLASQKSSEALTILSENLMLKEVLKEDEYKFKALTEAADKLDSVEIQLQSVLEENKALSIDESRSKWQVEKLENQLISADKKTLELLKDLGTESNKTVAIQDRFIKSLEQYSSELREEKRKERKYQRKRERETDRARSVRFTNHFYYISIYLIRFYHLSFSRMTTIGRRYMQ